MPTFEEQNNSAELIARGLRGASTDSPTQTLAVSKTAPGITVGGASVGQTSNPGTIAPTDIQFQAYTKPAKQQPSLSRILQARLIQATRRIIGTQQSTHSSNRRIVFVPS